MENLFAGAMSVLMRRLVVALLLAQFVVPVPVSGGELGTTLLGGGGKIPGKVPVLWRRPVDPIVRSPRPTRLGRFTDRPGTDTRRGLGEHSVWRHPGPGRKGGPARDIKLRETLRRG